MSSLLDTLYQALGDDTVDGISQRIGAPPDQTKTAIQQTIPVILGALGQEAADPERAPGLHKALAEDHDGSVVDNLQAYISGALPGKATDGQGILEHILGERQPAAQEALAKKSGLDLGSIASLLPLLAPIVMSLLGKRQRTGSIGVNDLGSILSGETRSATQTQPDIGDLIGSILGGR